MKISAFVGHSFTKEDAPVVSEILRALNAIKKTLTDFDWEHAEDPEPKDLRDKVLAKIEGKNLFIGICTVKEKVTNPINLKPRFFDRDSWWGKREAFEAKTSDWIIQEIGLAIGRGMELILLVEEGLRRPGGLQGNVEYITFSRANVSEVFPKLAEMIASLRPRPAVQSTQVAAVEKAETPESKGPPDTEKKLNPQANWSKEDYTSGLIHTVFDKNEDQEERIAEAFMASPFAENQDDVVDFRSLRLDVQHFCGKSDAAKDMIALSKEFPDNPKVLTRLARIYDFDQQPEQSAKIYVDLLSRATNNKDKISYGTTSVVKQAKLGYFETVDSQLAELDCLEDLSVTDEAEILKAKARVALAKGDDLLFCALMEGVLFREPEDTDLRFEVARKYEELNHSSVAMKHYVILCNKKPTETNWNNLGVSYQRQNLSGPSVHAYLKSKELKGTLAVSNLAYLLINAGFYQQAEEWCREALKTENCDERVGSALAAVEQGREKDQKEETAARSKARSKVDFFCEVSAAALGKRIKDGSYFFKDKKGNYELKVIGNKIGAVFEYETKQNSLGGLLGRHPDQVKKFRVTINGAIFGHSGVYRKDIDEIGATLLTGEHKTIKGVFLISTDGSRVRFYDGETGEMIDQSALQD